jgi:hypothetical protein
VVDMRSRDLKGIFGEAPLVEGLKVGGEG